MPLARAAREPVIPATYAHWLHQEVNYLITSDERNAFLQLKTDAARDQFIELFWRARNPDPNAPTNAVKEAHYERLAYANAHFGYGNTQDGWRSDRGMVYITLGKPQQVEKHVETLELKPIEIWFYENTGGALPTHFYVMFYKQSAAEDYELYSPYGDRPQKLINSTNAVNDDKTAIRLIQRDANDEVARISLSLIPGEPVDLKNPEPSLESDVMLNNIRNYRNLPQVRELLAAGRAATEGVSHRLVLGKQFSDLAVMATRDGEKRASVHYLMRFAQPQDFSLAEQSDGRYYYSLLVETELAGADGKVVAKESHPLSDYVSRSDFAKLQGKCFGVEGRLAAEPGKYELRLKLTNQVTKQTFTQARSVLVPEPGDRLGISQIFFAADTAPARDAGGQQPFSFSGVKLAPIGADNAVIAQGSPLRMIVQLWEAPGAPEQLHGKSLKVHYLVGKVNTQTRQEDDQTIDRGGFDANGNLLFGKDLRTDTLVPGNYRLVVKVTDPETNATAYQSLNFEVADSSRSVAKLWTVEVPAARSN